MNQLKAIRESRKMTQDDIAKAVGVSRIAVLKWERNLSVPNAKYLPKLAQALDCPVETILRFYA